jgi:hypothetical protein
MRREAKKIGHSRRVGLVEGLHQPEPGFVHHAIDVVAALQVRKRAEEDRSGQSAEAAADLFEKLTSGSFIPLTEAVEQRLQLDRAIFSHTIFQSQLVALPPVVANRPGPARPEADDRLLSLLGAGGSRKRFGSRPTVRHP